MSWRYSGNYCGWAPLPPAAGFSMGVGLTYNGHNVSGSFGFGLGVSSYTFVPVNRFAEPHPRRYALPHGTASQVYHQTTPSVTLVSHGSRVFNRGIPVAHVETAAHTRIHRVGIREVNTPTAPGGRAERLGANNQTLSVYRPQFPQHGGTQPAPNGRPRPEVRQNGASGLLAPRPAAQPGGAGGMTAPAPATPRGSLTPPGRTIGGNSFTQPNSGGGASKRPDRSALSTSAAPAAPAAAPATPATRSISDSAPRRGEPLILRGSDRAQGSMAESSVGARSEKYPPNSVIIRGSGSGGGRLPSSPSSASIAEVPAARPPTPRQEPVARPSVTPNTRPTMIAENGAQATAPSRWSAPRTIEPQVRSERPQQVSAPAYQAPVPVPRSTPAPAYTPPRAQSYTPPMPSPAPRSEPIVSQPVRSAPSVPATPQAPSMPSRAQPSPNRNGR